MKRLLFAALAGFAMARPTSAFAAGDDDPISYDAVPEEEASDEATRQRRFRKGRRDGFAPVNQDDDDEDPSKHRLASADDPNTGVALELLAGAMLFESSRGAGVDPRFMAGARFTWEMGRHLGEEFLRERLFADVTWQTATTQDGTLQVNGQASQHYFTVAPAFALPFGEHSPIAAFGQLGVGLNYDASSLTIDKVTTPIAGLKPVFQYGLGLRGRPALTADGTIRLAFRVEFTRFARGYMHDTFLGAGIGLVF
jgi:hypothetical protein